MVANAIVLARYIHLTMEAKGIIKYIKLKIGTPKGNRTPDSAVRGRRLNRLTMRARQSNEEQIYYIFALSLKLFYHNKLIFANDWSNFLKKPA